MDNVASLATAIIGPTSFHQRAEEELSQQCSRSLFFDMPKLEPQRASFIAYLNSSNDVCGPVEVERT